MYILTVKEPETGRVQYYGPKPGGHPLYSAFYHNPRNARRFPKAKDAERIKARIERSIGIKEEIFWSGADPDTLEVVLT